MTTRAYTLLKPHRFNGRLHETVTPPISPALANWLAMQGVIPRNEVPEVQAPQVTAAKRMPVRRGGGCAGCGR